MHKINSSSSVDQIKLFKNLSQQVDDDGSISRIFFNIYFTARVKHPAKAFAQSSFRKLEEEKALKIISEEMKMKIESFQNSTMNDRNHFISCLNEASQNFKIIFKGTSETTLIFLVKTLEGFYAQLHEDVSPSEKNLIANHLHSTIQIILCCLRSNQNLIAHVSKKN